MATIEHERKPDPARRGERPTSPRLPPPLPLAKRPEETLLAGKLEDPREHGIDLGRYGFAGESAIRLQRVLSSEEPSEALAAALRRICRRESGAMDVVAVAGSLDASDLGRFGHLLASALRELDGNAERRERRSIFEGLAPLARVLAASLGDPQSGEGCALALGAFLKSKRAGPAHEAAQDLAAEALLSALAAGGQSGECAACALVAWRNRSFTGAYGGAQERLFAMLSGESSSLAAFGLAASSAVLRYSKRAEQRQLSESLSGRLEQRLPDLLANLAKEGDPSGSAYALCVLLDSRDAGRRKRVAGAVSRAAEGAGASGRALIGGYMLDRPFFVEALSRAYLRPVVETLGGRTEEDLVAALRNRPGDLYEATRRRGELAMSYLIDHLSAEYSSDDGAKRAVERFFLDRTGLLDKAVESPAAWQGAAALAHELASALLPDRREEAERFVLAFRRALEAQGLPGAELLGLSEKGSGFSGAWSMADAPGNLTLRVNQTLERLEELAALRPGAAAELNRLCGIRHFGRYPRSILLDQLELMTSRVRPEGGLIAAFYPVGDHNGAFFEAKPLVAAHEHAKRLSAGLVICEAASLTELLGHMLRVAKRLGPIDVGIFGGHGQSHSFELRSDSRLDLRAIEALEKKGLHTRLFSRQPSFLLFSCSTGKRWGIAERGASILSALGPTVSAPEMPAYLKDVEVGMWREDGQLRATASFGPAGTKRYTGSTWLGSFLRAFAVPYV